MPFGMAMHKINRINKIYIVLQTLCILSKKLKRPARGTIDQLPHGYPIRRWLTHQL